MCSDEHPLPGSSTHDHAAAAAAILLLRHAGDLRRDRGGDKRTTRSSKQVELLLRARLVFPLLISRAAKLARALHALRCKMCLMPFTATHIMPAGLVPAGAPAAWRSLGAAPCAGAGPVGCGLRGQHALRQPAAQPAAVGWRHRWALAAAHVQLKPAVAAAAEPRVDGDWQVVQGAVSDAVTAGRNHSCMAWPFGNQAVVLHFPMLFSLDSAS